MTERNERRELQEKMLAYRILESRINSLAKQREFLAEKLVELQTTLVSIDEIEKSKDEILFPLGSEAYTFGKILDKNKVIVEVGAGIVLEKNITEARDILHKRMNDFENALTTVQRNMQETSESLQVLEPEIQQMIDKQHSQQQTQTQERD